MFNDHDLFTRWLDSHGEMLREAEQERMARLARQGTPTLRSKLLRGIGNGLIATGSRLRAAAGETLEPSE